MELAFFSSSKKIATKYNAGSKQRSMCSNIHLRHFDACCQQPLNLNPYATSFCNFHFERSTYITASDRCQEKSISGSLCNWSGIDSWSNTCNNFYEEEGFFWTNQDCEVKVKGMSRCFIDNCFSMLISLTFSLYSFF